MTAGFTAHSGLRPEAKRYIMAGRGVVVDAGGRGDYTTVQDAVDYMAARSEAGRVWIREGTYYETVTADVADMFIEGASWDVLVDGEVSGNAFTMTADGINLSNLSAKTTGGGGQTTRAVHITGGNFSRVSRVRCVDADHSGIESAAAGTKLVIDHCLISDSDGSMIVLSGPYSRVQNCHLEGNSGIGIYIDETGDNALITGNHIAGSSHSNAIQVHANAENNAIVGNISDSGISDSSGTSTSTGNEQY
tara:strand:- start:372 stop:1118 length:747 start_codon:yes stop_codon:yes gene_type:complete